MAYEELLTLLQTRFEANYARHSNLPWAAVQTRLMAAPNKLKTLQKMEATGGEPDVIGRGDDGLFLYCDCCTQSPAGRRGLCFDAAAQKERQAKRITPAGNVLDMAADMLQSYPNIHAVKIEPESLPAIAATYQVFSIPVLILFVDGKETLREAGIISLNALEEKIARYYNLFYE